MAGPHRVIAVFRHRARAEQVQHELEDIGLGGLEIALEDRRATDDPPEEPPAAAVEPVERLRDKEVAGHVFKTAAGLSLLYTAAGLVLGALAGGAIWGFDTVWFWAALAVGGVTGTVLGAIQGGISAAMDESEKEEGTLLVVDAPDPATAGRVESELRRREPERVERTPGPQRMAG